MVDGRGKKWKFVILEVFKLLNQLKRFLRNEGWLLPRIILGWLLPRLAATKEGFGGWGEEAVKTATYPTHCTRIP